MMSIDFSPFLLLVRDGGISKQHMVWSTFTMSKGSILCVFLAIIIVFETCAGDHHNLKEFVGIVSACSHTNVVSPLPSLKPTTAGLETFDPQSTSNLSDLDFKTSFETALP